MSSIAESTASIRLGRSQYERSRLERRQRALLYTAASILAVLVMFPFLWLLQMSVRPNDDIFGYDLAFTPTFEHYASLWTGHFPGSFWNSVVASTASTAHEAESAGRGCPDRAQGAWARVTRGVVYHCQPRLPGPRKRPTK